MRIFKLFLYISSSFWFLGCASDGNSSSSSASATTYQPTVQTSLSMILSDTVATTGSVFCMDMRVKDFKEIVSIQYSVNWDPKVLKFQKVQGFQLDGLGENSFGLTNTDRGKLGISWYDASIKGLSLPQGKSIYQICFEVTGTSGQSSSVRISNDPVMIEVSNAAERILGIPTGKGMVRVQ